MMKTIFALAVLTFITSMAHADCVSGPNVLNGGAPAIICYSGSGGGGPTAVGAGCTLGITVDQTKDSFTGDSCGASGSSGPYGVMLVFAVADGSREQQIVNNQCYNDYNQAVDALKKHRLDGTCPVEPSECSISKRNENCTDASYPFGLKLTMNASKDVSSEIDFCYAEKNQASQVLKTFKTNGICPN